MTHIYNKMRDYRLNNKGRAKGYIDIVELILVSLIYPFSIWVTRTVFIPELDVKIFESIFFFAFILISWYVLAHVTAMAKIPRTQRYLTLAFQFARVAFIIFICLLGIKVIFRLTSLPILLIVLFVFTLFVTSLTYRILVYKALKAYRSYGKSLHNVLIVADAFSDGIIEKLRIQKEWGFHVSAIQTQSKLIKSKYGDFIPIISDEESIKSVIDNQIIDEVIYCKRDLDPQFINNVIEICDEVGIIFRLQSSVSPLDTAEFQLKTLNRSRDLSIVDSPSNNLSLILKNMGDIYISIFASIILLPFFLFIAIFIRIGSKGPVIFKQERIGLRGRKFNLYKFRTMVVDAEEQKKLLRPMNEADGPVFKIKNDPRITKFGRFLRRRGFDELPQLLNVIKGEMSLIGPRPPLQEEIEQYERKQLQRLSVKPGISCSWQIIPNRNNLSFEEWMQLDLRYINNWNLFKDLGLFFKTVKTFFVAGGH